MRGHYLLPETRERKNNNVIVIIGFQGYVESKSESPVHCNMATRTTTTTAMAAAHTKEEEARASGKKRRSKGEIINSWRPWRVVPLFLREPSDSLFPKLPQYDASAQDPLADLQQSLATINHSTDLYRGLQRLFKRSKNTGHWWCTYVVTAAVELVLQGENIKDTVQGANKENSFGQEEEEIIGEVWTWIQTVISFGNWKLLCNYVSEHFFVVSSRHPLEAYATQVVPRLTRDEVHIVVGMLGMQAKFTSKSDVGNNPNSTMALRLSQLLQESNPPRQYGVILSAKDRKQFSSRFRHSCLPNAIMELQSPSLINIINLYDDSESSEKEQVGICTLPLDGGSVEQQARLRCQKEAKPCLLCQYQNNKSINLQWHEAVQLGHHYFQQERYKEAAHLYHLALEQNDALDDIRHALGALHLAQNHFLDAQLAWKRASEEMKILDRKPDNHSGIALQLQKQVAYHYLDESPPSVRNYQKGSVESYNYKSYFDRQCFVTHMLDEETCKNLIDMATTSNKWTTNRHYAVPTNDIPVHTEPNLLEWFYPWMEKECAPLLMKQFDIQSSTKQRFYVHDAFFVRYQGSKSNNHLPCHCDECSHSFVICLNDDFEGGGTYFHDHNVTLVPKAGDVVSFKGDTLRHGGDAVTAGTRYIIAVFCYLDRCASSKDDTNFHERLSTDQSSKKHKIQAVFKDAKKKKMEGFSFGFNF